MGIKQNGGVFGRNPTFNDVTIEGDLIINGEVFSGLDFQGSWNASTNTPALASGTGTKGEFYIVSVAGTTSLDGITNWGIGDWALFNGTVWQRIEGGADGNFADLTVSGTSTLTGGAYLGGTGATHLLNDYEEDTWTPVVTSTVGTLTTVSATGTYTKIGRLVYIDYNILITANGTGSGGIKVEGLPFAASSYRASGVGFETDAVGFLISSNVIGLTSLFYLNKYDGTYPGGTSYRLQGSLTYKV